MLVEKKRVLSLNHRHLTVYVAVQSIFLAHRVYVCFMS